MEHLDFIRWVEVKNLFLPNGKGPSFQFQAGILVASSSLKIVRNWLLKSEFKFCVGRDG